MEIKERTRDAKLGCSTWQGRSAFRIALHPIVLQLGGKSAVPDAGPDLELTEFRLSELEAMLRTMEAGPERDYFAGVLANRTGHIAESIGLLNSVLPTIRLSRSDRTAVALQALADDYNKTMTFSLGKLLSPGKVN